MEPLGFGSETVLEVAQPSAIAGFAKLASETPMTTWRDYLAAHVLSNAAPLLSSAFVQANFDYAGSALAGTPALSDRWKRAVAQVNASMGDTCGTRLRRRNTFRLKPRPRSKRWWPN